MPVKFTPPFGDNQLPRLPAYNPGVRFALRSFVLAARHGALIYVRDLVKLVK